MRYRYRELTGLSPLAYVWEYELSQPTRETILPNGYTVLAICLRGPVFFKGDNNSLVLHRGDMLMAGHQLAPFETISRGYRLLGLQLHSLLFRAITGMEAAAITNQHIWGDEIITGATALRDRCLEAPNLEARVAILEQWLREQLCDSYELNLAISLEKAVTEQLLHDPAAVGAIENMSGYSRAQTYRIAKEWLGAAPGTYWRSKKFLHSLHMLHEAGDIMGSGIRAGFYDHPHFTRWFKRLAGMAPSQYVKQRSGFRGHLYDETNVQGHPGR